MKTRGVGERFRVYPYTWYVYGKISQPRARSQELRKAGNRPQNLSLARLCQIERSRRELTFSKKNRVSNHQTCWQIHILVNYSIQNPHFPVREAIKNSNCYLFTDRKRVFFREVIKMICPSNNIYNTQSDCALSFGVNSTGPIFKNILYFRNN